MSDKYFKKKANEICDYFDIDLSSSGLQQEFIIKLKEIARDQRYACVDSLSHTERSQGLDQTSYDEIHKLIMNADIKEKPE